MSDKAEVSFKVKKAIQLLLAQRPRVVGVKGSELRRIIGKEYTSLLDILRIELDRLGLELKVVHEGEDQNQLDQARFFILLKNPLSLSEAASAGWRIDDLAALAATLAFIISRQGKASRSEVEKLLRVKLPKWKVDLNLDRFIRRGYLERNGEDLLVIGWRTRAEIDQKTLLNLVLASPSFEGRDKMPENQLV